jgi:hypothetical protein
LYGVNHRLGQARVREVTRQQALPQRGHTLNR